MFLFYQQIFYVKLSSLVYICSLILFYYKAHILNFHCMPSPFIRSTRHLYLYRTNKTFLLNYHYFLFCRSRRHLYFILSITRARRETQILSLANQFGPGPDPTFRGVMDCQAIVSLGPHFAETSEVEVL